MAISTRARLAQSLASLGLLALAGTVPAMEAQAHGSMEVPLSRVYRCFLEGPEAPRTAACRAVVKHGGTQPLYDWMEVNQFEANGAHKRIAPDGKLCAGGRDKYKGLDLRRNDWPTTRIRPDAKGRFKFVYHATTPHATNYFQFYITQDGWRPTEGLTWTNIDRIATVRSPEATNGRYSFDVRMPKGKTGRHVVYVIWQRSDSKEAFYSCSDIVLLAPAARSASAKSAETDKGDPAWTEAGRAIARNDLPAGTTIAFRVFDPIGGDAERLVLKLRSGEGASDQWPAVLAAKVNAESEIFRIGVMAEAGDAVVPTQSATDNRVYLSGAYEGYTYTIDVDTP